MEMPEGLITMCWERMSKTFDNLDNKIQSVKDVITVELHKAYNDGYEAAKKEFVEKTYEQGLNDAWECAKKITCDENVGGLSSSELIQIFNNNSYVASILMENSPEEAIAKIKQYEKGLNDIRVGDEVYYCDHKHRFVVTALLEDKRAVLISANGKWITEYLSRLHKTGKHYSELEIIFSELKGNRDE